MAWLRGLSVMIVVATVWGWQSKDLPHRRHTAGCRHGLPPSSRLTCLTRQNPSRGRWSAPHSVRDSRLRAEWAESEEDTIHGSAHADKEKLDLRLLLIDHYDSFTYNLVDLLGQICREPPQVLAADCARDWQELQRMLQHEEQDGIFDGILLSPGPGHPADDTCALSASILRHHPTTPVLGVCLGHQIMGLVYGASCVTAPEPVHGQVQPLQIVCSPDDPLWRGLVSTNSSSTTVPVTRYHSLHVTDWKDTALQPTAMFAADDDDDNRILMAMRHVERPHFGLQFHPESIGTKDGKQLLSNFCQICNQAKQMQKKTIEDQEEANAKTANGARLKSLTSPLESHAAVAPPSVTKHKVYIHKIERKGTSRIMLPDDVMQVLLKDLSFPFWLDEAAADDRTVAVSLLGASPSERVEYWGMEKELEQRGLHIWRKEAGEESYVHDPSKDILTHLHERHAVTTDSTILVSYDSMGAVQLDSYEENEIHSIVPFQYRGGHVGYLGYEVRHDTERYLTEEEHGHRRYNGQQPELLPSKSDPNIPTAAFVWADRSYVFDHLSKDLYLVGIVDESASPDKIVEWMSSQAAVIQQWMSSDDSVTSTVSNEEARAISHKRKVSFTPNRSREMYNRNFNTCLEHIRNGDSYELCLTNHLEAIVEVPNSTPLDFYRILRNRNPAPFSAFLDWNSCQKGSSLTGSALAICCSSPERFVSVKRKVTPSRDSGFRLEVEAKPIKGTCARVIPRDGGSTLTHEEVAEDNRRARALQSSVKNRAENLMIVDLLRNDLSRVCQTGSVHVAKLMDIESYATVHQMVSTIRGTLDPSKSSTVDVLRACFPGGSMTGAPKLRTMELLHDMEEGVSRGPYSGCMGYISVNGAIDMNIIIRTAVLTPQNDQFRWKVSIGAGGAITALSESDDEYEEMTLKASAVIEAVQRWTSQDAGALLRRASKQRKLTGKRTR